MTNQHFNITSPLKGNFSRDRKFGGANKNFIRKNEKIRVKEVRVIGSDGSQIGVMPTVDAIAMAISYMDMHDKPDNLKYNVFAIRNELIKQIKTR